MKTSIFTLIALMCTIAFYSCEKDDDIMASDTDTENSTSTEPKSTLYTEPYMVFGSTVSQVKSNETRTILSETSTVIMYNGSGSETYVGYLFSNNALWNCAVYIPTSLSSELTEFLSERYTMTTYNGNIMFYDTQKTIMGEITTITLNGVSHYQIQYIEY